VRWFFLTGKALIKQLQRQSTDNNIYYNINFTKSCQKKMNNINLTHKFLCSKNKNTKLIKKNANLIP